MTPASQTLGVSETPRVLPRPDLNTLELYRRRFCDAAYWADCVRIVCERHGLLPCRSIANRVPGTYPTFIVNDRWVVKFFGRLFEGEASFRTELDANRLVAADGGIPAPALLAQGSLFPSHSAGQTDVRGDGEAGDGWPWPYLIFECAPGDSLGEVYEQVGFDDKLGLARQLGRMARRLHQTPIDGAGVLQPTWDAYRQLLDERRGKCVEDHRAWGTPARWVDQMEEFLAPVEQLIDDSAPPSLLHADLTADHILGRFDGGRWSMAGLIDFGDAMVGDPAYELIALHLDAFRCDRRLLAAFLAAYDPAGGGRAGRGMIERARHLTLLHRFDVLAVAVARLPGADAPADLGELMAAVWGGS